MSTRPVGACLAWLVARVERRYQHAKRTHKRTRVVIGGVDTHGRTHHAAVIDQPGRLLGDQEFPADKKGSGSYRLLLSWLGRHRQLDAVGRKAPAATAPA